MRNKTNNKVKNAFSGLIFCINWNPGVKTGVTGGGVGVHAQSIKPNRVERITSKQMLVLPPPLQPVGGGSTWGETPSESSGTTPSWCQDRVTSEAHGKACVTRTEETTCNG